ncbi:uncharacterized protein LOC114181044 isoform X2 [Vigna unguiculata]|uniref:uncharacterized protein LOC114181044 isoform X2 n=1 Tax=Vigna unguiculata TaxID=3917 RepID=UPI001016DA24|nr:uncharacterized protein LOC114181044 isoform X2 [Vigna unguiculata]
MLIMVEALVGDIVILDISATTTDQDESNVQIVPSAESKARYLSKSHTPTARSILAQKMASTTALDSIQESLLGSAIATQSAPASRMKSTLCLVSTLTFLGTINLLQPLTKNINHMDSNPRQQFVIHVGRKLFQLMQITTLITILEINHPVLISC